MTHQGRLTDWNDERGFGFVTPLQGGPSAFVHVSRFPRHLRRPRLNDLLLYSIVYDEQGRSQATGISFLSPAHRKAEFSVGPSLAPMLLVSAFSVVLVVAVLHGRIPGACLGDYAFASILLYVLYAADKSAALSGRWRISEASLHLVALLGGWPGGLIARHSLRHKTMKQPFRFVFGCTVVLNITGLVLVCSSIHSAAG